MFTAKCEDILEINREVRCSGSVYKDGKSYAPIQKSFSQTPTVDEIKAWLTDERDYYKNLNEGVGVLQKLIIAKAIEV